MVVADTIPLVPAARFELNQRRVNSTHAEVWNLLDQVKDPEIPVLSIWDLGVLQDVDVTDVAQGQEVTVTITPTYSGCPAIAAMAEDIQAVLRDNGYLRVNIVTQLAPAWTTDWLAPDARQRLHDYGVAPPGSLVCPQCGSKNVALISEFGSTACKSLHRCEDCAEPFDRFKTL